MKTRLHALLVHGMGQHASFWKPLMSGLRRMEIEPHALEMPSLEEKGPEGWVTALLEATSKLNGEPFILIGHSLGSAACLHAALQTPPEACLLLASPLYLKTIPQPPPEAGLSFNTQVRIAKFIRLPKGSDSAPFPMVHILGDKDEFVSVEQAGELPFPTLILPQRKHNFLHHEPARQALLEWIALSASGKKHLDPGILLSTLNPEGGFHLPNLCDRAPSAARLDVEITTHCQMSCPFCARTHPHHFSPAHMTLALFKKILELNPKARELIFVGLGEPLLHPHLETFVRLASEQHLSTQLVTNGLLADPERLSALHHCGLKEITFSLDSTDPEKFKRLRGGASLEEVQKNFLKVPACLSKSLFVTLSQENAGDLTGIIDFAEKAGLSALALSDLNFEHNQKNSLHRSHASPSLEKALHHANKKKIRLIGPHFHDVGQMPRDYRLCEIRALKEITQRVSVHRHCLAPWRIEVVDVNGNISPCNCAPFHFKGQMEGKPLPEQWNSASMRSWRMAMLKGTNTACTACPRY